MARAPTIADVAARAGVAKASVSKAFDGRPGRCDLAAPTVARIRAAAAALGWRPAVERRARARVRAGNIGLVYAAAAPPTGGVYERFAEAIADALARRGYRLLLAPVIGGASAWRRTLADLRLDGCIACDPAPDELVAALADGAIPAVLVNQASAAALAQVRADDAGGARTLVAYLRALGHRRIAYWQRPRGGGHASERARRDACADALCGARAIRLCAPETMADLVARRGGPTAVIAYNHDDALALMAALAARAIAVPARCSVACFDDVLATALSRPALTAVRVPLDAMGRRAAAIVVDLVEGRAAPPQPEVLPEPLVARASTAAAKPLPKPRRRRLR